jgi:hypothetical protein
MSEMAPEQWRNPRDPTFTDTCATCTHAWHGLPCVGVTNYRDTGPGCDCPGPYSHTDLEETA